MKLKKLLIAVFAAVTALMFVACDSPTKAVEEFCKGMAEKDADVVAERLYFSPEAKESIEATNMSESEFVKKVLIDNMSDKKAAEAKDVKVVKEEINGDSATVTVKNSDGNEMKIECIKVDGKWKIDFGKQ